MAPLTPEQLQHYATQGYLVLDLLSKEEVDTVSQEYDALFRRQREDKMECTWGGGWQKPTNPSAVYSIHGLHMHSAVFTRLLTHAPTLAACRQLMGTQNILLHHTKAHTKPPGKGSPFPMHQDYHYFPFKNDSMMAIFLNLDDSGPENGGLCVYPGSHLLGPQKDVSDSPAYHYLDDAKFPLSGATPLHLKRGQVLVFSYLLVHGSPANTSTRERRMLLTQVYAAEDEPLSEQHRSAAQGMVLCGANLRRTADIAARNSGH